MGTLGWQLVNTHKCMGWRDSVSEEYLSPSKTKQTEACELEWGSSNNDLALPGWKWRQVQRTPMLQTLVNLLCYVTFISNNTSSAPDQHTEHLLINTFCWMLSSILSPSHDKQPCTVCLPTCQFFILVTSNQERKSVPTTKTNPQCKNWQLPRSDVTVTQIRRGRNSNSCWHVN